MNEKLKYCARLKAEYYVKNIKMMYSWSHIPEDDVLGCLNIMGMAEYLDAIKWLLTHRSTLNAEINMILRELPNYFRGTLEYNKILDRLKVALVVCNKNQAVTIVSSVAHYSSNPKEDIDYLGTF